MDFWKAYNVLNRRKWAILIAVVLTTLGTFVAVNTFAKRYDAVAVVYPTDNAIRNAAMAGNDERSAPQVIVTEDIRLDESRRISSEIRGDDVASIARRNLLMAPTLAEALESVLGAGRGAGLKSSTDYEGVAGSVRAAREMMSDEAVSTLVLTTGIQYDLWADMVYLNNQRRDSNVPLDLIESRRFQDIAKAVTIPDLAAKRVVLSLRDKNQRLAELLASAIVATYRSNYNKDALLVATDNVRLYMELRASAHEDFRKAKENITAFLGTPDVVKYMPEKVNAALKANADAKAELDGIDVQLRDLDAQIAASRARLDSIDPMIRKTTKSEDPQIEQMRAKIAGLRTELNQQMATRQPDHPDVRRLKTQLAAAEEEYKRIQGRMYSTSTIIDNDEYLGRKRDISALRQRRDGLAARRTTLEGILVNTDAVLAAAPKTQAKDGTVRRQYATASERLDQVKKQLQQAQEDLEQAAAKSGLQVRYWAGNSPGQAAHQEILADTGGAKRNLALLAAAFLLSLLGSSLLFLGMEYMDRSVKDTADVERMLNVPVNGIVPRLPSGQKALMAKVTDSLPASPHAEAYRFLGTDLLLTASNEPFKTLMVATAKPNQGGTSTISNLAITLAQAGQTVALVDADLRRPSLHNVFNLSNEQGLSTVLSNGKLPGDVLQRTDVENLYVMTGGPAPENAWKLLRSPKMKEVISDLSRDFDFVLFDTPSASVFADAATLATMLDGVLLVVRAHEQPTGSEMQVKNLLNKTKARIVGVVLNDVPLSEVDSARYFTEYYGSDHPSEAVGAAATRPALPKRASDDEI